MSNENNHLYVGRHKDGAVGYVGIGGPTRPFKGHTPEADQVLKGGEVWITATPFSSRADAEMAESILIRALGWATEKSPRMTNVAKKSSSRDLVPALPFKDGSVNYEDFTNALFVKIRLGNLFGRPAPNGATDELGLALRCNRWWRLGQARARRADVRYLVAVTAGAQPPRVIGAWRTRPVDDWWFEDLDQPQLSRTRDEPFNSGVKRTESDPPAKGWVVTLESTYPNVGDWQGKQMNWGGYNPQNIGWSQDLKR